MKGIVLDFTMSSSSSSSSASVSVLGKRKASNEPDASNELVTAPFEVDWSDLLGEKASLLQVNDWLTIGCKIRNSCQTWLLKHPMPCQDVLNTYQKDYRFDDSLQGFSAEQQQTVLYYRYVKAESTRMTRDHVMIHLKLHIPQWFFYNLDCQADPECEADVIWGLEWMAKNPRHFIEKERWLFPVTGKGPMKLHDEVYNKKACQSIRNKLKRVQNSLTRWEQSQNKGRDRKPSPKRCDQLMHTLETLLCQVCTILRTGALYQNEVYFPTKINKSSLYEKGYLCARQVMALVSFCRTYEAIRLRQRHTAVNISYEDVDTIVSSTDIDGCVMDKLLAILKLYQNPERQPFLTLKENIMEALRQLPGVGQSNLHQVAAQEAAAELAADVAQQDQDEYQQDQDELMGLDAEYM